MKVLQVSPAFPYPPSDGGKIVIYSLYKFFKKIENAEIDFICLNKDDVDTKYIKEFDEEKTPIVKIDKGISSKLRLLKSLAANKSYLIYKFFSEDFQKELENLVTTNDYDIIHFEGLHTAYYALSLIGKTKAKMVLRLHNVESQIIYRFLKNYKNPLMKLFFLREYIHIKNLEKNVFEKIKNIVFISDDDVKTSGIKNIEGSNPFVSTAGVDLKHFEGLRNNESKDLLFLGSMDWKPNEEAMLWFVNNVFSKVIGKDKTIRLYIVGKNPSSVVKALSSENVIVTGMVDDVRTYMKMTGIFIVPIKIGGGMRVKILEAAAAQKAIISTSIGAEGIKYENGKNILIADNEDEFAQSILNAANDSELRNRLCSNALQMAEEYYSWDSIIFDLYNYYKSL
ncbi:MAG TPA: glycosyltransferase family 4 protein [Ignavibacteriaceae bacterium]|nr:glycosyltransferase family 4 protein [Ignavibacteriaceae bacterium]